MRTADLLADAFVRIRDSVHEVVDNLTSEDLVFRPEGADNSIAWLVWHLARVQDDHVADVAGIEQVWTASGWAARFGLPLEGGDIGYGHTAEQAAAVTGDAQTLGGYYDAVHEMTLQFVRGVTDPDLDRIVDRRWDPPVSLGVRLVSVLCDDLQHVGQAAYVRGILERR